MPSLNERPRVGVLGGTFDPIHLGHLLIAESAREHLGLEQVRFLPAAQSPLKTENAPRATDRQRAEMVQLAIQGNDAFSIDDRELQRGGTSFTVDTLREMHHAAPSTEWVFLMGADSLVDFHRWKEPAAICQLAFVVVLARGGQAPPDLSLLEPHLPEEDRASRDDHLVPVKQVEISSSDLRQRLAQGRSVRYQLPAAVKAYIDAQQLYRG